MSLIHEQELSSQVLVQHVDALVASEKAAAGIPRPFDFKTPNAAVSVNPCRGGG